MKILFVLKNVILGGLDSFSITPSGGISKDNEIDILMLSARPCLSVKGDTSLDQNADER